MKVLVDRVVTWSYKLLNIRVPFVYIFTCLGIVIVFYFEGSNDVRMIFVIRFMKLSSRFREVAKVS